MTIRHYCPFLAGSSILQCPLSLSLSCLTELGMIFLIAFWLCEAPQDKTALQRIWGMAGFLVEYIPSEAVLADPPRKLLQDDIIWQWAP